ncbi:histidine kinase dimerization/phosphoacceptor domain-containing protein [Corynebacterium bovis]|uniref:histidine kinase dimerization/phosphoacceptor domain-containing protein n=1 Tax=Corynebacterium bovis TaxID=36808 RepID=UPI003138B21C
MSLPTTTPHGAPGPDAPAGVADRGWPPGFRRGPVRFVLSGAAWRAVGWTVVLALVAVPLCVASVLLLPLLPVVARVSDALGRAGARWTGAPVTLRGRGGWQGWQRMVLLGVLDVLGVVALGVVGGAGGLVGGGIVGAVVAVLHPGDARMTLGSGEVTWTPGIVGVALIVAVLALVVLVYLSWLLSGLSVWATTAANAPTGRDIERLERSRAVLADAVDAERRRIERELHDGVQQYLTALQLSLGTLELALRRDAAAPGTEATGTAGDPGAPGGRRDRRARRGRSPRWSARSRRHSSTPAGRRRPCAPPFAASTRRCSATGGSAMRCGNSSRTPGWTAGSRRPPPRVRTAPSPPPRPSCCTTARRRA